jgi:hypothetical protein
MLARICGRGLATLLFSLPSVASLAETHAPSAPLRVAGIPADFILFALTLLSVAVFHRRTLQVALAGLASIIAYKLAFAGFKHGARLAGLASHMAHEWVILRTSFSC